MLIFISALYFLLFISLAFSIHAIFGSVWASLLIFRKFIFEQSLATNLVVNLRIQLHLKIYIYILTLLENDKI